MIESAEVTALRAELAQAQLELEEAAKILQGSGYPGVGSLLLIAVARIEAAQGALFHAKSKILCVTGASARGGANGHGGALVAWA